MDTSFRGIFDAHPLMPSRYGLLSIARLTDKIAAKTVVDVEEKWIRGYSHIYETNPTIRLLQDNGAMAHVINDATGSKRFIDVKSFYLEVEDYASTFDIPGEDRIAKIIRQLEGGTQKSIEHEFYKGYVARANNNNNQYLTKGSTSEIINNGAVALMHEGFGYLEYALAQSPVGELGIIHMTRDMAAMLGSNWVIQREDEEGITHLESTNGTPIVVGSGYDGSGPQAAMISVAISSQHTATITTSTVHALSVSDLVSIEGQGAPFDGTWTVTSVPSTTEFSFTIPNAAAVTQTAATAGARAFFAPDQTHKFMWGTGLIDVVLGDIEVVTTSYAQGYDVTGNKNDERLKAIRPVAVHHDPTIHVGVKVQVHE
jgi:hypothetical protein